MALAIALISREERKVVRKFIILILLLVSLIELFSDGEKTEENAREIEGFTFLQEKTHSAGGQTNTIKEYRHDRTGIEFVLVPGGSFMMGSDDGHDVEKPVHRVNIKEFFLSKYEVTQGQWKEIMGTSPWVGRHFVEEGKDSPATYVSWINAKQFWIKTDLRLPSEAEWEYACRAGTTTKHYWGNKMDGNYAWWDGNANGMGEEYPHKVGQKKPNAFGLYDMSGNVWEWCEDKAHMGYSDAPSDGSAWLKSEGSFRILRGGGWGDNVFGLRSAHRRWFSFHSRLNFIGFRVSYSPYRLTTIEFSLFWPLTVHPPKKKRNLVSLGEDYKMEFLYVNENAQLPQNIFFPYNSLKEMTHPAFRLSRRAFFDQMERLFNSSGQISSAIHFEWNQELGTYYSKLRQMENGRIQAFRYSYANGHKIKATIYEDGLKPEGFIGNHPILKVTPQQKDSMVLIWKISPKQGIQRGFPKYIMD